MPRIIKQRTRKPKRSIQRKKKRGVLSVIERIVPLNERPRPKLCVNLYGQSGTGKTTIACSFPKPLLLIGAEDGTESVYDVEGVDFVPLYRAEEFSELVEMLNNSKFETAVLDTLGTLYDLELCSVLGIEEMPATGSWGMASRDQWQQCNTRVINRLRPFLSLHRECCNTLILAQERVYTPTEDSGDIIMPFVASASTPGVVGWLNPACNHIAQTFIQPKTVQKKRTIGKKTKIIKNRVPGIDYCLRTMPDPTYMTKFRKPKGSKITEFIVDPTYDKIRSLIDQGS